MKIKIQLKHFFGQSCYNNVVCGLMLTRNSLNLAHITANVSTTKKYFLRIISQSKSVEFQSTVSFGEHQEACHSSLICNRHTVFVSLGSINLKLNISMLKCQKMERPLSYILLSCALVSFKLFPTAFKFREIHNFIQGVSKAVSKYDLNKTLIPCEHFFLNQSHRFLSTMEAVLTMKLTNPMIPCYFTTSLF